MDASQRVRAAAQHALPAFQYVGAGAGVSFYDDESYFIAGPKIGTLFYLTDALGFSAEYSPVWEEEEETWDHGVGVGVFYIFE